MLTLLFVANLAWPSGCSLDHPNLKQFTVDVAAPGVDPLFVEQGAVTLEPGASGVGVHVRAALEINGTMKDARFWLVRFVASAEGVVRVEAGQRVSLVTAGDQLVAHARSGDVRVSIPVRCEDVSPRSVSAAGFTKIHASGDGTRWISTTPLLSMAADAQGANVITISLSRAVVLHRTDTSHRRWRVLLKEGRIGVHGWVEPSALRPYERPAGAVGSLGLGSGIPEPPQCHDAIPAAGATRIRATVKPGTPVHAMPDGPTWATLNTREPVGVAITEHGAWVQLEEVQGFASMRSTCVRQLSHAWIARESITILSRYADRTGATEPQHSPLKNVTQISAGALHTCAVTSDGAVYCWGFNAHGQLGRKGPIHHGYAKKVPLKGPQVEVAAGESFTCARDKKGTVTCWGATGMYGFGKGDAQPPAVVEGLKGVKAIRAGARHACVIDAKNNVQCFGDGSEGQRARVAHPEPPPAWRDIPVMGALGGPAVPAHKDELPRTPYPPNKIAAAGSAKDVAVGDTFSVSLTTHGTVLAWGRLPGDLGASSQPWSFLPVSQLIAARGFTVCGGTKDGRVLCRSSADLAPRAVELPGAKALSVGRGFVCALTANGTVHCQGERLPMLMGSSPDALVTIPGIQGAVSLTAGDSHVCVINKERTVTCWGDDEDGQLGGGPTAADVPVSLDLPRDVVRIAIGSLHACALHLGGRVTCWGDNTDGQLGIPPSPNVLEPRETGIEDAVALAAGKAFTCIIRKSGQLRCWGYMADSALGVSNATVQIPDITDAVEVGAGPDRACVRRSNGELRCFGNNANGQAGGPGGSVSLPQPLLAGASTFRSLALSRNATCALLADGKAACLGKMERNHKVPSEPWIWEVEAHFTEIGAGVDHLCFLDGTGHVTCRGESAGERLGVGPDCHGCIRPAVGLEDAVHVAAGAQHSCAARRDGTVACWGTLISTYRTWQRWGLDHKLREFGVIPALVPHLEGVVDIASGPHDVCAILQGGEVRCLGDNQSGQLGSGQRKPQFVRVLREQVH